MAEETGNPVIDAGQFLGEDGAFSENWLEQAYGETDPMRSDPTLVNTKTVRSMASQLVNAQKQIGQFAGGREFAILPNEQSDEAEIKEYHKKTGVPDDVAGYLLNDIPVPEGQTKDEKFIEHMGQTMLGAGVPATMAAKMTKGYMDYFQSSLEAAATQDKIDMQVANKELRGMWGAAYDLNMRNAVAAVNAFGREIDAAESDAMIKELPYDSFAAQLLAKAGEVIAEKPLGDKPPDVTGDLTPATAMTEINKIMTDPYYVTDSPKDKPRNKAYHDELVEKAKQLFEIRANKGGV